MSILNKELKLLVRAMKPFSKKLLGHDNLSSMIVSGYEIFQEYFK